MHVAKRLGDRRLGTTCCAIVCNALVAALQHVRHNKCPRPKGLQRSRLQTAHVQLVKDCKALDFLTISQAIV